MPPHKIRQRQTYASQQSLWNTSAKHRENIVTSRTSQRDEPSSKNITRTSLRCIMYNLYYHKTYCIILIILYAPYAFVKFK